MRQVRAVWLVRDNLLTQPGGDTTQVLQTRAAIERLGVSVRLDSGPSFDASGCDLVHLFHLDRLWEHLPVCRRLRRLGLPVALSTIYWPGDDFDARGRVGLQGLLARTVGPRVYPSLRLVQRQGIHALRHGLWRGWDPRLLRFTHAARYLLDTAAVVLPNGRAELAEIERRFGPVRAAVVVPNAVDGSQFHEPPPGEAPPREGVLCVGRLEPRKNQLSLIRAMRGLDAPLTLVGRAGRFSAAYHRRCRDEAGKGVTFLDQRSHRELRDLYWRAAVHACVSWYETPGLASMEAAACGCAIVVSTGGCTREYFGRDALYCRPDDTASIRGSLQAALELPPRRDFADEFASRFTWDEAARATLDGYRAALGRPNHQLATP